MTITIQKEESIYYFQPKRLIKLSLMSVSICAALVMTGCASLPLPTRSQVSTANYGVPPTERTVAQRFTDESIAKTAKINLRNFDADLGKSRIDVDSFFNIVLLTGEVPNETAKLNAQNLVVSMPDVKGVYNELKVGTPHTMSYHMHDMYITSKFRSKVLASPTLSSSQITVVTEMGTVYVLGRVTAEQRQELIDLGSKTPGILEFVMLTETISLGS